MPRRRSLRVGNGSGAPFLAGVLRKSFFNRRALDVDEPLSREPRLTCYRCFRPSALCYCGSVETLTPRSQVVVLQHQREIFHPLNTTRMLELALPGARIERGNLDELERALLRAPLPPGAALLFPSPDAEELLDAHAREPITAIVALDGTWDQAKTLLRLSGLEGVRRVRFRPKAPSEYRIRKEPKVDYLSTLESVALVLELLEPDLEVERLRRLFRSVIDRNVEARPRALSSGRTRLRGRGRGYRPPSVYRAPTKVVVYAEGAKVAGPGGTATEPLLVEARRLEGGAVVASRSWILRTSAAPLDVLLGHLALTPSAVAEGRSVAEVRAELESFVARAPVFVWAPSTARLLRALGGPASVVLLKGTYFDYARFRARESGALPGGGLEDALRSEGIAPPSVAASRAVRRVEESVALAAFLEGLARDA